MLGQETIYKCPNMLRHRRRNRQKKRQRSSLLFGGRNSFTSMPHYRFSARMIGRIWWIHPFLQIILVQLILFFNSSERKIYSGTRNLINSVLQTAAMIFTFSSVFILLLCALLYQPQNISMDSAISFPATILPHQATSVWPESDGIWRREFLSMGALVSGMNSLQIHTEGTRRL